MLPSLSPHDDLHVRELTMPEGWLAERVFREDQTSFYQLTSTASDLVFHIEPQGITDYEVVLMCGRSVDAAADHVSPGELQDVINSLIEEGD